MVAVTPARVRKVATWRRYRIARQNQLKIDRTGPVQKPTLYCTLWPMDQTLKPILTGDDCRRRIAEIDLEDYPHYVDRFGAKVLAAVELYNVETRNGTVFTAPAPPTQRIRRVAIYARVSTRDKGQDIENQLQALREYCKARRWPIVEEYIDHATGKTSDRIRFKQLFVDAGRNNFDLVLFWALDRFSREGVLDTLQHLQKLTAADIDWRSFTEQYLDSCGIFRDAVLAILATIAKQERVRMTERTIAGLARAKREGKQIGRPKRIANREQILTLRESGMSFGGIAKRLSLPRSTVFQYFQEVTAARAGVTASVKPAATP